MTLTESLAGGDLTITQDVHVGHLTFNRPTRKNAINAAMWAAIPKALERLVHNGARVILISGAGKTDFSAGADIAEFDTYRKDAETSRNYEQLNSNAFRAVRETPVPVISAIRGICFGGGLGIAAASDIRLADQTARFAVPASKLGLAYPVDAMTDIIAMMGPQLTRFALYSGAEISAQAMEKVGGVINLEAPENLAIAAQTFAEQIAKNAPLSIRASKLAVRAVISGNAETSKQAKAAGDATFTSRDYAEGRAAFKDRRKPHFTGE